MNRISGWTGAHLTGIPRASGDEPWAAYTEFGDEMYSPRERG